MITAIAIDDEPLALQIVESFCASSDLVQLQKTFSKPNEALKHIKSFPVDLLFLDINMPGLSGIELYKAVKQDTMVIFTTAHMEYAVEGFNLNAVDYLLKPFTLERFNQAVEKAAEFHRFRNMRDADEHKYLFVRADNALVKINLPDILYIEGLDDYLKIHIENQKTLVVRMTMKGILEKLSPKDFVRVHRSFIIPFGRIKSVRNKEIAIGETRIPIGNSYEEGFLKLFQ